MISPRQLVRFVTRDPDHVPERLLLASQERLARQAVKWAGAIGTSAGPEQRERAALSERRRTITMARGEGAVAGTPFFIALVPAYLTFLEQEARFFLRMAALHGRDPASIDVAAEMLAIRGVHPDAASSAEQLRWVLDNPLPPGKDDRESRGFTAAIRDWYRAVMKVMVFAGFIGPPDPNAPKRSRIHSIVRNTATGLFAAAIWIGTSIFPVTFMMVMSWSCEGDARRFSEATLAHYGLEPESRSERRERRREMSRRDRLAGAIHGLLVLVSVAIPLFLMAASVSSNRWGFGIGIETWVASLAGLALAIGLAVSVLRNPDPEPDA